MRTIDQDIKVLNDDLNEVKNNLAAISKKDGTSYMTKDISEEIYGDQQIKPQDFFIEVHGSQFLSTVIVVLHRLAIY